ncbi:MAG TPA: Asp-tRNA(Asn)/Glu-tRNA(Gln) amidotransferase subunit GatB [Candidatus Dormibacteraeota bacterium]|nr:Asp-tRNA(Asn)/Glu-tRNA(Gln) amidotransferase subunit GatB [Candidatus Dormibacteraeota bacterium]
MSSDGWEVVIGMEVHVQPKTLSKMFCGCAIAPLNAPPNTYTCEICLGLPGVLPVINRAAVEATLKAALALGCEIPRHTKWDRKNYMYPDLPKGYQISQYDLPMSINGHLDLGGRRVGIRRVHLEEDTGKLIHAGDKLQRAWESYVDLNRAGVPLMEIVSEPDIRSAEEARDYAMELQRVLRYVGASEADMEKGQMRAEPNISIRRAGSHELGVKTELKNINSFRALYRAIGYEVDRQQKLIESGGSVVQETRGWSEPEQRTFSQRSKEFAEDYRYFPEPDLPPLELDRAWIDELRLGLPELPSVRRSRLLKELPPSVAVAISADRDLADLYESAIAAGAPTVSTANWIVNEAAPSGKLVSGDYLAELMKLSESGVITRDQARETYFESAESGRTPAEIVAEHGFAQVSDPSELRVIAEAVIDANPKAVADFRAGKKQAMQALMADLRKRAPSANPKVANELLLKLLANGRGHC